MDNNDTTPGESESPGEGHIPVVRLCPFPGGNDTEFSYPLSIHGAWMLSYGIEEYALQARRMHESGETASYCLLMTQTAIDQTEKLRAWARRVDAEYLDCTIQRLGELLAELASQRDRFAALASEERTGGGACPAAVG
jgi:hypothetical protein